MSLKALLEERRTAIQERWIRLILDTYPDDTVVFLKKQRDRFANPVGHAIHTGMGEVLQALIDGEAPDGFVERLDALLRIRAVQHFAPSQALAFVFRLKSAIRSELKAELKDAKLTEELVALEERVDALGLLGFDIYTRCREQVYELRLRELRNQTTDVKERILAKQGKWEKLAELQEKKRQRGEAVTLEVLHATPGAERPEEPGDTEAGDTPEASTPTKNTNEDTTAE